MAGFEGETGLDRSRLSRAKGVRAAFTLIELLVVIAMIALVAATRLPALGRAQADGRRTQCMNNVRQLGSGWLMYAQDNSDQLAANGSEEFLPFDPLNQDPLVDPSFQLGGAYAQWCPGNLQNLSQCMGKYYTNYLKAGVIFPYIQNIASYKCPAMNMKVPTNDPYGPLINRSYAMNCWVGVGKGNTQIWVPTGWRYYPKLSSMTTPGPANTWVFIEESMMGIDDGYFVVDPTRQTPTEWWELPAVVHGNGTVMVYGDGHSAVRNWTDQQMLRATSSPYCPNNFVETGTSSDFQWLVSVSTAPY